MISDENENTEIQKNKNKMVELKLDSKAGLLDNLTLLKNNFNSLKESLDMSNIFSNIENLYNSMLKKIVIMFNDKFYDLKEKIIIKNEEVRKMYSFNNQNNLSKIKLNDYKLDKNMSLKQKLEIYKNKTLLIKEKVNLIEKSNEIAIEANEIFQNPISNYVRKNEDSIDLLSNYQSFSNKIFDKKSNNLNVNFISNQTSFLLNGKSILVNTKGCYNNAMMTEKLKVEGSYILKGKIQFYSSNPLFSIGFYCVYSENKHISQICSCNNTLDNQSIMAFYNSSKIKANFLTGFIYHFEMKYKYSKTGERKIEFKILSNENSKELIVAQEEIPINFNTKFEEMNVFLGFCKSLNAKVELELLSNLN